MSLFSSEHIERKLENGGRNLKLGIFGEHNSVEMVVGVRLNVGIK